MELSHGVDPIPISILWDRLKEIKKEGGEKLFEMKEGKLIFKPDDEKAAKAGGRSLTIKIEGERLSKLQGILSRTGWKNPTRESASESTKWYTEQAALRIIALKLLDGAISQHISK